jgi:hypothetical protein
VWLFTGLNERKLFHRDEAFEVSTEFSEGSSSDSARDQDTIRW